MRTLLKLFTVVGLSLSVATARAEDGKIALDKLPKAVVEALKTKFPKAKSDEAMTKTVDGKTRYVAVLFEEKLKLHATLKEDGTITEWEKALTPKQFPKAVLDAVAEKYPKGKVEGGEVIYIVKDGKDTIWFYEVELEIDGKTLEVKFLPDGKPKPETK